MKRQFPSYEPTRLLQAILETSQDGFWEYQVETRRFFFSLRFWEMLGFHDKTTGDYCSLEEATAMVTQDGLESMASLLDSFFEKRQKQEPLVSEVCLKRKDHSSLWVLMRAKVVEWDEKGNPLRVFGANTDISELKQAQESLVTGAKMLALGEMASGIAHEINNPLTIMKGYADLIQRMYHKGTIQNEEVFESAKQISLSAIRMSKIIEGLRNFSLKSDETKFERVSPRKIVEEVFDFCLEKFKSHGIDVQLECQFDGEVRASAIGLSQVLLNLLNNAFYVARDSKDRWIRVEIREHHNGVLFSVSDSGPGVPIEIRDRIMQPFFTTKPVSEGTGLGLSVSQGILKAHGGTLTLNETAQHTQFDVWIPNLPI